MRQCSQSTLLRGLCVEAMNVPFLQQLQPFPTALCRAYFGGQLASRTDTCVSWRIRITHVRHSAVVKGLITDLTNMNHSVLEGINKLGRDIASGVHVGKDDLDDGMFEHAEASKRQRHSSQHQSAKQFAICQHDRTRWKKREERGGKAR